MSDAERARCRPSPLMGLPQECSAMLPFAAAPQAHHPADSDRSTARIELAVSTQSCRRFRGWCVKQADFLYARPSYWRNKIDMRVLTNMWPLIVWLFGRYRSAGRLETRRPRCCPVCLFPAPCGRGEWGLDLQVARPHHDVLLPELAHQRSAVISNLGDSTVSPAWSAF